MSLIPVELKEATEIALLNSLLETKKEVYMVVHESSNWKKEKNPKSFFEIYYFSVIYRIFNKITIFDTVNALFNV